MPKVLRIINRFNLGGPTYNASYLTAGLSPDFETLLIGGENELSEESSLHIPQQLNIAPTIVKGMQRSVSFKNDRIAYQEIKKIIKQFEPDIVHTHASKAGFLGRMAANNCKTPIIVHTFHGHVFHSYFGNAKTAVYKNLERYLAKKSTSIVAISDIQKKELTVDHKICKPDKVTVIPLGFDLQKFNENQSVKRKNFRHKYQLQDDTIAVGIIGRLVPIKNHTMFLKSLKLMFERTDKKIQAFIIGDGEEKEAIQQQIGILNMSFSEEINPDAQIIFTSWIKDVDEPLAGLDVVALTSLNEGTPVSLIEAQAASKPIVSTNVGGIADIVIPEKSALLCKSNECESFSAHLLNLISNDKLRIKMGQQGYQMVSNKFNRENLVANMKTHYLNLLNNR